jgi:UDP-glucose 4-epimerase
MTKLIVVTGGAGFIGSNLARLIAERGDAVRVIDNLSIGHLAYLDGVPHSLIRGSLADPDAVRAAVADAWAVVHLAARAGIPDSVADPLGTFEANVSQTVRLLEAARRAGVRRLVIASSNAAAGDHEPPSDEADLPHPLSPYGASKLAGEAYVQAYAATYGLAACALRFSNAYGPYSLHKKSVVAAWLRAALGGEPLVIHGDGEQTRDFVHAEDLARGVLSALDAPEADVAGEVFQIGTSVETTVNQLAEAVERAVGRPLAVERRAGRAGDVRRNVSRIDKARARLRFEPRVALEDGLRVTASWYARALVDPILSTIEPHIQSGSE